MRVLKVVAKGITTSFRYPHFMQQVHPTYSMPPPSTIYGHIASALGEWFDPTGVRFAYHFTYDAEAQDLEHIIVLVPKGGRSKLKGTKIPKVLEGKINPFERHFLFNPRLTLYINQPDWLDAFRSPHYTVVLGRSQDLFTYSNVEVVELQQTKRAYFEHTLLPYDASRHISRGYAITMPRYLDYEDRRQPTFDQYFVVNHRIQSEEFLWFGEKTYEQYWTDPNSPKINDSHLGLMFHSFIEGEHAT